MQANQPDELDIIQRLRALGPEWEGIGQPIAHAQPLAIPPADETQALLTLGTLDKIHQFLTASHALLSALRVPRVISNIINCENSPSAAPLPGTKKHWRLATAFSVVSVPLLAWAVLSGPGKLAPEAEKIATAPSSGKLVRGTGTVYTPTERLADKLTKRLPLRTAQASNAIGQGFKARTTKNFKDVIYPVPESITQLINISARSEGMNAQGVTQIFVRESRLGKKPISKVVTAKSDTSAAGIVQFTEQTWLWKLATEGHRLGYSHYADAITTGKRKDGTTYWHAGKRQQEILDLRNNYEIAIPVGASFMRYNAMGLKSALGRMPTNAEVDLAHFTGLATAIKIIDAYHKGHHKVLAYTLAEPVNYDSSHTNRSMFFRGGFKKDSHAYTVAEFYNYFVNKSTPEIASAPALVNN